MDEISGFYISTPSAIYKDEHFLAVSTNVQFADILRCSNASYRKFLQRKQGVSSVRYSERNILCVSS